MQALQRRRHSIVELVDLIVVNKCDGDLKSAAGRIAADYHGALGLLRSPSPHWQPKVAQCSALEGTGIDEVWASVGRCVEALRLGGDLSRRRTLQLRDWMVQEVTDGVLDVLRRDKVAAALTKKLETEVAARRILPPVAAQQIRDTFFGQR